MSFRGNLDANLPKEKISSLSKLKTAEQVRNEQKKVAIQQQESQTTGIQWAAQVVDPGQTQQTSQVNPKRNSNQLNNQGKGSKVEIMLPGIEDLATLTTTAAIKQESVAVVERRSLMNFVRSGLNMAALEESYREIYRKSKSHNLLLERFMSNVKFSALKSLLSLMGLSAEEQTRMQKEVREQALAEIDSRLKNEWANAKAMLDIVG
ncbi:hypothetical protein A2291_08075 [candidate division WOR-1 bacterium RIFOXYB2_FULL_42_35]|uniref:Uncharacterized protein n=1 Tax=candidate division WOR-1 bacterium RIFOXYC2_FULL_41_25 TaxID=1802586 RepID=A0A1F4TIL8_UNCSA|nr:MAG: hypothetical protein A2247_01965 [candidate division WOR-1 bacterium RIFOXYA2_FULL_41_14]OGC24044.1 MAG: hypothetical protein A2291_08075 [candidate division WOR-1 bacterium RIFOXYB2_FULL_42_35]OGC32467.1 MAG: hypothetical protein A2462_00175 [candidate division WOR-1 bacterium RIFOXYC2_FULL_41_25]